MDEEKIKIAITLIIVAVIIILIYYVVFYKPVINNTTVVPSPTTLIPPNAVSLRLTDGDEKSLTTDGADSFYFSPTTANSNNQKWLYDPSTDLVINPVYNLCMTSSSPNPTTCVTSDTNQQWKIVGNKLVNVGNTSISWIFAPFSLPIWRLISGGSSISTNGPGSFYWEQTATKANQQWIYDPSTKLIINPATGLYFSGTGIVGLATNTADQQWDLVNNKLVNVSDSTLLTPFPFELPTSCTAPDNSWSTSVANTGLAITKTCATGATQTATCNPDGSWDIQACPSYSFGTIYPNPTWSFFWSNSPSSTFDLGEDATNLLFSKTGIICRTCSNCSTDTVYYKRLTPIPFGWSVYSNLINVWTSVNNLINVDFQLFGSLQDLINGTNAWLYCNYDDVTSQIGGFRDCAPSQGSSISAGWNTSGPLSATSKTVNYYVLNLPGVAGVQPSIPGANSLFRLTDGNGNSLSTDGTITTVVPNLYT